MRARTLSILLSIILLMSIAPALFMQVPSASACNTSNIYVSDGGSYSSVYGPDGNNGDTTRYVDYGKTTQMEKGGTHHFKFKITISPGCGSIYECMFKTNYKPDGWTVKIIDNTSSVGKAQGSDIDGVMMGDLDVAKDGFSDTVTYVCDVIVTAATDAPLGKTGNYVEVEVYSEDKACNDADHIYVKLKFDIVEPHDPPQITLTSPAANYEASMSIDIAWTATDTETPAGDLKISILYKLITAELWTIGASDIENTGSYTWDCSKVKDGDYNLRVRASDNGHPKKSTDSGVPITINNPNAPDVVLTAPSEEGTEVHEMFMFINWTATDEEEDDSNLLIDLQYKVSGVYEWLNIAQDLPNTGTYTWNITEMEDRPDYRIKVIAKDSDGMEGEATSTYKHTINNLDGPVVKSIYPTGGLEFSGRLVVYWEAEDPDGDDLDIMIEISEDAGETWTILANDICNNERCSFPIETTDYADGDQYVLRVTASDGDVPGYKTTEPFTIFNNDPPEIKILTPSTGDSLAGDVDITWESEDQETATEDMIVDIYYKIGLSSWKSIIANIPNLGSEIWYTHSGTFEDGTYSLRIDITDEHGEITQSEVLTGLEVFNPDPPELSVDSPEFNTTVKGNLAFSWKAIDNDDDDVVRTSLFYSTDLESWTLIMGDISGLNHAWDTNSVDDGLYHFKVETFDGTFSTVEIIKNVTIFNYVSYDPTVIIQSPIMMDKVKDNTIVRWMAEDMNEEDVLKITISYSRDYSNYIDIATEIDDTGEFQWDVSELDNGEYTLKITATDPMGNTGFEVSDKFFIENDDEIIDNGPIDNDKDKDGEQKESSSSGVIIGVSVVALILVLGLVLGIVLFTRMKKADTADPLTQPLPGMEPNKELGPGISSGGLPQPEQMQRPGLPPSQP